MSREQILQKAYDGPFLETLKSARTEIYDGPFLETLKSARVPRSLSARPGA